MAQYDESNPYRSPSVLLPNEQIHLRFPWWTTAFNGAAALSPGLLFVGFNGVPSLLRLVGVTTIFLITPWAVSLLVAGVIRTFSPTPFSTRLKQSLMVLNILLSFVYLLFAYALLGVNLKIHFDFRLPGF